MVIPTETVDNKVVETMQAMFKMRPTLEQVDIIHSAHGGNTFVRFYTPGECEEMERRALLMFTWGTNLYKISFIDLH